MKKYSWLPDSGVLFVLVLLCGAVFPSNSFAQCNSGNPGTPGGISYFPPQLCSGKDPHESILVSRTTTVEGFNTCQEGNWKSTSVGTSSLTADAAVQCEQAIEGTSPVCAPEFQGPTYVGVIAGKFRFSYSAKGAVADPEDGAGCIPNQFFSATFNESLTAAGCCSQFCQDQQACEEDTSKIYRASPICRCEDKPVCQEPEACSNEPPCTVDQVLDEACNCCKPAETPVIVDLSDNGIKFVAPIDGVLFDISGNGRVARVSWPSSETAYWLALDRNGNGVIDSGAELFGSATRLSNGKKAAHGYLALAELDANADGVIDATDPAFSRLLLWRRPLPTGTSQPADAYIPISGSVVRSIRLDVEEVGKRDEWGNRFRYRARVLLRNEIPRWSYDVFLRTLSATTAAPMKK